MEFWEFLLQKEGDRSWLPLEGPIASILEGRYRIIARSSHSNTPVTCKVSYQGESDLALVNGPQDRSRTAQTNGEGLIVILPFTALKPGEWRFECTGPETAPSEPPPWHYQLCLQVDPYEEEPWLETSFGQDDLGNDLATVLNGVGLGTAEIPQRVANGAASHSLAIEDTDPGDPPEIHSAEINPAPSASTVNLEGTLENGPVDGVDGAAGPLNRPAPILPSAYPAIAPQISTEIPTEAIPTEIPSAPPSQAPTPDPDPIPMAAAEVVAESAANESVTDESQEAQTAQAVETQVTEETVEAGPIQSDFPVPAIAPPPEEPPLLATLPGDVRIRLQRSTYITAWGAHITLNGTLEPNQRELLGAAIPATCQLKAVLRDPATQQVLVRLQMPLLQALEGDRPTQAIPLPCHFSFPVELPLETSTYLLLGELSAHALINSSEPPLTQQTFTVAADIDVLAKAVDPGFTPETCSTPEQISNPIPSQHPTFTTGSPQKSAPNLDLQFLSFVSAPDGSRSPQLSPQTQPPLESPASPSAQSLNSTVLDQNTLDQNTLDQNTPTPTPSPAAPPTPNFRPLNPHPKQGRGRFWTRLSAFAQGTQEKWLQDYQDDHAAPPKPEPTAADAHLTDREILIDPDLDQPLSSPAPDPLAQSPSSTASPQQLPTPTLGVPAEPLMCGHPVTIHLQVPEIAERRIGLKFWIQDRQTRQLLEPPRWVLDLMPNGRGALDSRVTAIVPPGVLEVQFEAIAIDLETQHTGQKVSQSCRCTTHPDPNTTERTTQVYPLPNNGNQLFGSDW